MCFAIVDVEALLCIRRDFAWTQRSRCREVDVHIAIIVGIDDSGTACYLFDEVVLAAAAKVLDKVEACGLGGIFKVRIGHGAHNGCDRILALNRLIIRTSSGGKQKCPKDGGSATESVVHR